MSITRIAVLETRAFLGHDDGIDTIVLACFSDEMLAAYRKGLGD